MSKYCKEQLNITKYTKKSKKNVTKKRYKSPGYTCGNNSPNSIMRVTSDKAKISRGVRRFDDCANSDRDISEKRHKRASSNKFTNSFQGYFDTSDKGERGNKTTKNITQEKKVLKARLLKFRESIQDRMKRHSLNSNGNHHYHNTGNFNRNVDSSISPKKNPKSFTNLYRKNYPLASIDITKIKPYSSKHSNGISNMDWLNITTHGNDGYQTEKYSNTYKKKSLNHTQEIILNDNIVVKQRISGLRPEKRDPNKNSGKNVNSAKLAKRIKEKEEFHRIEGNYMNNGNTQHTYYQKKSKNNSRDGNNLSNTIDDRKMYYNYQDNNLYSKTNENKFRDSDYNQTDQHEESYEKMT